ncbi:DUF1922 domain-containing protein [[Eubacterium] cellulosolvens]
MGKFLVIICDKCCKQLLAFRSYKTRHCPYCGHQINITMNKVVAETESIEQARKILDREKRVRGAKMDRENELSFLN